MSNSSAMITTLAAFENGRRADGNALIFDAQIYLGDGKPPLLAALRYFNKELRVFDDIGFFLIIARVAKIEPGVHIALQPATGMLENDYDLVGDVMILIPLPDDFNIAYRPYIDICGTVASVDNLTSTFTIDAHQYVTALKNNGNHATHEPVMLPTVDPSPSRNASNSHAQFHSIMPVECKIPNTPRWTRSGKKILPARNRYVSITGFITDQKPHGSQSATMERFCVEIESIVYLGRPMVSSSASTPASPTVGNPRRKMKFDFSAPRAAKQARVEQDHGGESTT
ncbi:hypothetical protein EDD17DRAFT_1754935 [Pisolithus thermaeus]|nr:hypothetical protein EDD17DRAFT_1754935 [Pisolithus thermaeus]